MALSTDQDPSRALRKLRLALCVLMTLLTLQFISVHAGSLPGAPADGANRVTPSSLATMPRLGLNTGDQMDAPALDNAGASGVRMARVSVYWDSIEPINTDPSHYNWTSMDSIFSRISARGLQPFATVLSCPAWACVVGDGPLYSNMYTETVQFMSAMAARYSQPPYNVHYWEMWNEPDSAGGPNLQNNWGMHPAQYAQMLSMVYPAVKAADPDAALFGGGLAYDFWFNQGGSFNPDFLPDLLDAGGANYMDAIGFHYYTENAHGWTDISIKVAEMRGVMAVHGAPNLPLICTETGKTSSTTYGGSEAIQSRYLVQMNVHAAKAGVRATLWYLNRDFIAPIPGWESFAHDGLTRLDNTRKSSFTAMQVLSQEVGSNLYLRQVGAEEGVIGTLEGYRFAGAVPARQVSVVWNNAPVATTMVVPAAQAPNLLSAINLYGQSVAIQPGPGNTRLLSVGLDPVYLRWQVPRFSDVPFDSWMYPYVEYLASHGIISGYADGTFRPGSSSTRGQFSKMVVLGMGWPINTAGGPHFRDVPTTHTYYAYVETAYNRGIIGGYNCGGSDPCPGFYFHPMSNITRAQISKIVVLAKGWTLVTPVTPTFSDVPRGSTFYAYIETAVSHGVVSGYADHTFHPGNSATRGQLSKMLALALQQP